MIDKKLDNILKKYKDNTNRVVEAGVYLDSLGIDDPIAKYNEKVEEYRQTFGSLRKYITEDISMYECLLYHRTRNIMQDIRNGI